MKAYVDARVRCERELMRAGCRQASCGPFYVLGPGHRWPYALMPMYWLAGRLHLRRSQRLGLVTIRQMVRALACAVENPPPVSDIFDVPRIRSLTLPPRTEAPDRKLK